MVFRNDIQVLRGVSVLMVVLFHLKITGFSSGFLGVDVFFVISGYLMSMLYKPEHKIEFFARRIRRLLPAYLAVVLATLMISVVLISPIDFGSISKQAIYSLLFSSNIGFWLENSYFANSNFKPLLHLWSLGVEFHFYLAVPLLSFFVRKNVSFYLLFLFGSLALCLFMLTLSPKTSFFFMPTRLWEFMLGFGVARYADFSKGTTLRNYIVGIVGLVIVLLIPLFPVDGMSGSIIFGHPALAAIIVCIGTSLVLAFGLPSSLEKSYAGKILCWFGKYSYSIYLVHFPLIVLWNYQPYAGTVLQSESSFHVIAQVSSILLISIFLYFLIEKKFALFSRAKLASSLFMLMVVIAITAFFGNRLKWSMVPENESIIYKAEYDRGIYRCGAVFRYSNPFSLSCSLLGNESSAEHRFFLVGNSHADSIKDKFSELASKYKSDVIFSADNDPLMPGGVSVSDIVDEARSKGVDTIVLHYSPTKLPLNNISKLLENISEDNIDVALLLPVPVWDTHIPAALLAHERGLAELPKQSYSDYHVMNASILFQLKHESYSGLSTYGMVGSICDPNCRIRSSNGAPYYYDEGHLTLTGAELFEAVFEKLIKNSLQRH